MLALSYSAPQGLSLVKFMEDRAGCYSCPPMFSGNLSLDCSTSSPWDILSRCLRSVPQWAQFPWPRLWGRRPPDIPWRPRVHYWPSMNWGNWRCCHGDAVSWPQSQWWWVPSWAGSPSPSSWWPPPQSRLWLRWLHRLYQRHCNQAGNTEWLTLRVKMAQHKTIGTPVC